MEGGTKFGFKLTETKTLEMYIYSIRKIFTRTTQLYILFYILVTMENPYTPQVLVMTSVCSERPGERRKVTLI